MPRFNRLEFPDDDSPAPPPRKAAEAERPEKRYKSSVADWMHEADTHRRLGLYEEALRSYGRALECERSHVDAWVGQARMLILLDEPRQAEMWTVSGLKVFPGNADLLAARAQAICRLGNHREAMQYNDAAIQGEGNSPYRWTVRGELMTAAKSSTAGHCFDSAEQMDPDWLIRVDHANILRYYHAPLKGISRATVAVHAAPDAPLAWLTKGICEFEAGFNTEAVKSLEHALQLKPDLREAKRWLAAVENDPRLLQRLWRFFWRR